MGAWGSGLGEWGSCGMLRRGYIPILWELGVTFMIGSISRGAELTARKVPFEIEHYSF